MRRFAFLLFVSLVLVACSRHAPPPAGRWVGHYEGNGIVVVTRLEIAPNGTVRASAPNMLDPGSLSDDDRAAMHARLASDLADDWDQVLPRQMDFDGHIFRKPGGYAPQMIWDAKTRQMKVVFYFGTQHSIAIPVHEVKDFSGDPWES